MDGTFFISIRVYNVKAFRHGVGIFFPAEKDIDIFTGAACASNTETFSQKFFFFIVIIDAGKIKDSGRITAIFAAGKIFSYSIAGAV